MLCNFVVSDDDFANNVEMHKPALIHTCRETGLGAGFNEYRVYVCFLKEAAKKKKNSKWPGH